MHQSAEFASIDSSTQARQGGADWLALALQATRRDTLTTFAAYQRALGPTLVVPQDDGLNPPLWELGHVGWFQAHWLMRNPQRRLGADADPGAARLPYGRAAADRWYDSSRVAQGTRWHLDLPDADTARADLAQQLNDALALLRDADDTDQQLYFHRLALVHEDMHHEAALYMARGLGIEIADPRWQPKQAAGARRPLEFDAGPWTMGWPEAGFAFDNELSPCEQALPACHIDSRVLNWAEYLPFVEAGGYGDARWWSEDGRKWLHQTQAHAPLFLQRDSSGWWQHSASGLRRLDMLQPAEHLNAHEARAWCRWAGRRLPTEAEWERAACTRAVDFAWGQVWEWTASPFAPFPGFRPHPYRDYSQPWFDGRPVLRGGSYLTQPRMRHVRYRNFFSPGRNDVATGFRTCAP